MADHMWNGKEMIMMPLLLAGGVEYKKTKMLDGVGKRSHEPGSRYHNQQRYAHVAESFAGHVHYSCDLPAYEVTSLPPSSPPVLDGTEERPAAELEPWQWDEVVSIVNASLASQSAQPVIWSQQSRLFATYLENPQTSEETEIVEPEHDIEPLACFNGTDVSSRCSIRDDCKLRNDDHRSLFRDDFQAQSRPTSSLQCTRSWCSSQIVLRCTLAHQAKSMITIPFSTSDCVRRDIRATNERILSENARAHRRALDEVIADPFGILHGRVVT